jgi:hypothetical protein
VRVDVSGNAQLALADEPADLGPRLPLLVQDADPAMPEVVWREDGDATLILIGLSRFAWASAVPLSGTRKRMKKAPFLGEKSPAHTLDKRVSERGAERI